MSTSAVYVGLDIHKDSIVIAVARKGREAVEQWKTIPYDGVRLWKGVKSVKGGARRGTASGLIAAGRDFGGRGGWCYSTGLLTSTTSCSCSSLS